MKARRVCAGIWLSLVAVALLGDLGDQPIVIVFAWFGGLLMLGGTGSTIRAEATERLERPRLYRAVAAVAFVIPMATALLVELPTHSAWTTILAPYFAIVAWLQYRALVARGPRPALVAMCVSLLLWLPEMLFLGMGCKCGHYIAPPVHWTEPVTWAALIVSQLVNAVLAATALVSFARRTEELPEARLYGPWTTAPGAPAK
jgi:hypothetical protein